MRERNRQVARDVILDAAERLLGRGGATDFTMRTLAAEAGVGFATPFNHFGNKNEIMRALSARLIDRMADAFRGRHSAGDLVDRLLVMGEVAVGLLLEKPAVYKGVVGSLGVAGETPTAVLKQSRALWSMAAGDLDGIAADLGDTAGRRLAEQLAFGFRGCLSFWIAGEVGDDELGGVVRDTLATALLGFVSAGYRTRVLARLAGG